jgi:hypothetical protein
MSSFWTRIMRRKLNGNGPTASGGTTEGSQSAKRHAAPSANEPRAVDAGRRSPDQSQPQEVRFGMEQQTSQQPGMTRAAQLADDRTGVAPVTSEDYGTQSRPNAEQGSSSESCSYDSPSGSGSNDSNGSTD